MSRKRKIIIFILASTAIVFTLTIWANITVNQVAKRFITDDLANVKPNNIGLLLGTSRNLCET